MAEMAYTEVRAPSKMAKMSKQEASSQEDVDYIAENMDVMFEVVNNLLQVRALNYVLTFDFTIHNRYSHFD